MPIILSGESNTFLKFKWLKLPTCYIDPIASKIGVWTSGNYNAGTKTFSWTAQTPFTFVNWFYGEPRNTGQDQCLHVRIVPQLSASWATLACDQWMPFICQNDLEEEISLAEITAILSELKKEVEDLKKILIGNIFLAIKIRSLLN